MRVVGKASWKFQIGTIEKVYVRKLVQLKNIPLSRSFQRLFFTITRMLTLAYVKLEMVVGKIEMLESFLLAKFFPAKNFPTLRSFQQPFPT